MTGAKHSIPVSKDVKRNEMRIASERNPRKYVNKKMNGFFKINHFTLFI